MKKIRILKNIAMLPTILSTLVIGGCTKVEDVTEEIDLEYDLNEYAEKYQQNFFNKLKETYVYHDWYKSPDLFCTSPAEAIIMWTYGPGYTIWGTKLHEGKEEFMKGDEIEQEGWIGVPDYHSPRRLSQNVHRPAEGESKNLPVRYKDYQLLDQALDYSTAGEDVTVWHGFEYNEVEMVKAINDGLGLIDSNILTMDPIEAAKIDLNAKLKGKNIKDLCWCATSFSEDLSRGWANNNTIWNEEGQDKPLYNVPLYKIHVDKNVHCAYVSYTRQKWFDGIYLSWPFEYQLLTERNLNFQITNSYWEKRPNNLGNYLIIECDATRTRE